MRSLIWSMKKINYIFVIVSVIIANSIKANTLSGIYECFYPLMDSVFSLELYTNDKYKKEIKFIGVEKAITPVMKNLSPLFHNKI